MTLTAPPGMRSLRELRHADSLFAAGHFDQAELIYREAGAQHPDEFAVAARLGHLALLGNRLDEAVAWLVTAHGLEPHASTVRGLLAEAYYRKGAFSEAVLHLEALGRHAFAEVLAGFGDATAYSLASAACSTVLDWVACEPLPVVAASINGGSVNLVIDTGSGEVALDTSVAEDLQLQRGAPERGTFAGGRTATLRHGRVASLGLGDLELRSVPVQLYDVGGVFQAFFPQAPVHGILGTHLLSQFSTTIDYGRTRLVLRAPGCAPAADDGAVDTPPEPFWITGGHCIVAWARLNRSHEELMFIDTGATGAAVAVPQSTARRAGLAAPAGRVRAGHGGGGNVHALPLRVAALELASVIECDVTGMLLDAFPLERKFGFRIGGLLGHDFFRGHVLTLDFKAMRLSLQCGEPL